MTGSAISASLTINTRKRCSHKCRTLYHDRINLNDWGLFLNVAIAALLHDAPLTIWLPIKISATPARLPHPILNKIIFISFDPFGRFNYLIIRSKPITVKATITAVILNTKPSLRSLLNLNRLLWLLSND